MLKKTQEAFRINRSSCVHRSLSARVCALFEFCVRSPFNVHVLFTKLPSAFTHRSICVRSAFAHLSSWKVERFRDCIRWLKCCMSPMGINSTSNARSGHKIMVTVAKYQKLCSKQSNAIEQNLNMQIWTELVIITRKFDIFKSSAWRNLTNFTSYSLVAHVW